MRIHVHMRAHAIRIYNNIIIMCIITRRTVRDIEGEIVVVVIHPLEGRVIYEPASMKYGRSHLAYIHTHTHIYNLTHTMPTNVVCVCVYLIVPHAQHITCVYICVYCRRRRRRTIRCCAVSIIILYNNMIACTARITEVRKLAHFVGIVIRDVQ